MASNLTVWVMSSYPLRWQLKTEQIGTKQLIAKTRAVGDREPHFTLWHQTNNLAIVPVHILASICACEYHLLLVSRYRTLLCALPFNLETAFKSWVNSKFKSALL